MRLPLRACRMMLAPALMLTLATAVAACGSSGTSSAPAATTSPTATATAPVSASATSSSSAVAEITANWEKFFNSSTPTAQREALLENGSAFASAIASFSKLPLASGIEAKVTKVTVTSPTKASVTYNITSSSGSNLLSGRRGTAVYQDGTWKVGDASLCGLFKLIPGGAVPAACSSAG